MKKIQIILMILKFVLCVTALGIGIWYLSSSIGGAALTYSSMGNFMTAIGAGDGDIANVNGCFLCGYISELFGVIGRAAELFWGVMVDNIWILMVIGFGVFLFVHSYNHIIATMKQTANLDGKDKQLALQPWFDKVWRQGMRILVVGALIGALGLGGSTALKTVANITITPVLFTGAEFAMAASGVTDAATCTAMANIDIARGEVLAPIFGPFMCVIGNINSIMLAGAAGGFSLMNYAWMGLGGGLFTWLSGLALVLMFLVIGFDLFFQILSVVFKLVFYIIFLPLLLAAAAFEKTWKMADNLIKNAINQLVESALKILSITLKILVVYATVAYVADQYFPGPYDGYSSILPPMMGQQVKNPDAQALSVMNVFTTCERVALVDGEMDGDKFKECFTEQREIVERKYPGAFDFMDDGWDFLLMMIGLFALYFYVLSPKIDSLLPKSGKGLLVKDAGKEMFDFGTWTKDLGKKIWNSPVQIVQSVAKAAKKKS